MFTFVVAMAIKDYYTLLELPSSATRQEIKTAYLRLAHQHHPDKNNNDPYAAARFDGIKEAYEVLTNPAKKEYYLQQRWYDQSIGGRKKQDILTPISILKQMLEVDRYVSTLDVHRMDKDGLYAHISDILRDETIEKLNEFNDSSINKEIIRAILNCSKSLSLHLAISLYDHVTRINMEPDTVEMVSKWLQLHQQSHRREKYRVWVILLTVALVCLLIFFISR